MLDDTVTTLLDPSGFSPDPLTAVIRDGARNLIKQAVEAELATLLAAFADHRLEDAGPGWCAMDICRSVR